MESSTTSCERPRCVRPDVTPPATVVTGQQAAAASPCVCTPRDAFQRAWGNPGTSVLGLLKVRSALLPPQV